MPTLGRFASVDPVQGGSGGNSSYAYPVDPVNDFDLTGEWWSSQDSYRWWNSNNVQRIAHMTVNAGITVAAATGTAACIASVACGVGVAITGSIALTAAGTGAHYTLAHYGSSNRKYQQKSIATWAGNSAKSVAKGVVCGRLFGKGCTTGFFKPSPKSAGAAVPMANRARFVVKNTWRWIKRGLR